MFVQIDTTQIQRNQHMIDIPWFCQIYFLFKIIQWNTNKDVLSCIVVT